MYIQVKIELENGGRFEIESLLDTLNKFRRAGLENFTTRFSKKDNFIKMEFFPKHDDSHPEAYPENTLGHE